jgi:uncharacterized protein (DUF2267 family)
VLYVKGTSVMTYPEFFSLARELPDDFADTRLAALYYGDPDLEPGELYSALDITTRTRVSDTSSANNIIDAVLTRLKPLMSEQT